MKQSKLLFLLIAALAFDSCRPTAQQTVADLVITDKHLAQTDFLIRRTQKPVN